MVFGDWRSCGPDKKIKTVRENRGSAATYFSLLMPSPTLSLIPVGLLPDFRYFFYRIVIHPPLGFLFHPSVSSHADELIRGRIMQIMMVILFTIITIGRGERKIKTREEYKAGVE